MIDVKKLVSEFNLETTAADLYGLVNRELSFHLAENEVSEIYIGIYVGSKFFRFHKVYKLSEIEYRASEDADRVFEDVFHYFEDLPKSLACGDDKITVDSVVVIVE